MMDIDKLSKLSDEELDKYIADNFRKSLVILGGSKYSQKPCLQATLLTPTYEPNAVTGEMEEDYASQTVYCDSKETMDTLRVLSEEVTREGSYLHFEVLGEYQSTRGEPWEFNTWQTKPTML